ncbi:MAG: SAM-dependent methyltransferase [Blastocatellia bacterium]|nr:SAM-dependent methyltransferase [Blastocatellia bacterium]MCS7157488.1 SAM-dependent methyltransferase [Blastocatellia bacterium]MCX7752661.1 SAM-dependent methyltransferase [Blastocatellia bacterium]MDW8168392.1 SAM-dependent methyltransferase [Acidobacteriota bacterium]MDW8255588.1 SAM-dependent methyltransferase [Acidobacteriota bacterium]
MRPLEEKLKARIREAGPIPFRDFMHAALYDPEHGYYMRRARIGRHGDYVTSAHLHPIFGELLAEKFLALLRDLTPPWTLLEWGAGTGRLAADVLAAFDRKPEARSIRYLICEISPHLREEQRRLLGNRPNVAWVSEGDLEAERFTGLIFSNELLDAFPVHRVLRARGEWRELYVTVRGETFAWTLGELTRPEIAQYFEEIGIELEEGQIADVAIDIVPWLQRVAAILQEGYVVTIDYGDTAGRLYGRAHPMGTLRCFYRRQLVSDPFQHVGEQDITASVDFTLVERAGRAVGLEVVEFTSQREFLLKLGLLERASAWMQCATSSTEALTARLALKHFLVPSDLGETFKVLVQKRRCSTMVRGTEMA